MKTAVILAILFINFCAYAEDCVYTHIDDIRPMLLLMGTQTTAESDKYDFDDDGRITSADLCYFIIDLPPCGLVGWGEGGCPFKQSWESYSSQWFYNENYYDNFGSGRFIVTGLQFGDLEGKLCHPSYGPLYGAACSKTLILESPAWCKTATNTWSPYSMSMAIKKRPNNIYYGDGYYDILCGYMPIFGCVTDVEYSPLGVSALIGYNLTGNGVTGFMAEFGRYGIYSYNTFPDGYLPVQLRNKYKLELDRWLIDVNFSKYAISAEQYREPNIPSMREVLADWLTLYNYEIYAKAADNQGTLN